MHRLTNAIDRQKNRSTILRQQNRMHEPRVNPRSSIASVLSRSVILGSNVLPAARLIIGRVQRFFGIEFFGKGQTHAIAQNLNALRSAIPIVYHAQSAQSFQSLRNRIPNLEPNEIRPTIRRIHRALQQRSLEFNRQLRTRCLNHPARFWSVNPKETRLLVFDIKDRISQSPHSLVRHPNLLDTRLSNSVRYPQRRRLNLRFLSRSSRLVPQKTVRPHNMKRRRRNPIPLLVARGNQILSRMP